jgi:hypothetical protein
MTPFRNRTQRNEDFDEMPFSHLDLDASSDREDLYIEQFEEQHWRQQQALQNMFESANSNTIKFDW